VLATANSMMNADGSHERVYATAQLLHIDVRRGRVGHLNAGHPPALVRVPDGSVDVLNRALQPPIGTHLEPSELLYVPFPAGSLVLAYTDGLIERRSEPITTSIQHLAGSLGRVDVTGPLPQVLSAVISDTRSGIPDVNDDDYAAILVRRLP
jgi:serine phosphatase RsbU (regulator of sigma subunit)